MLFGFILMFNFFNASETIFPHASQFLNILLLPNNVFVNINIKI